MKIIAKKKSYLFFNNIFSVEILKIDLGLHLLLKFDSELCTNIKHKDDFYDTLPAL